MVLVDNIMVIIGHWSSRLLSFAGRTQLIKSVIFVISNYWMQCILIPKKVIKNVEAVCRTFCGLDLIRCLGSLI